MVLGLPRRRLPFLGTHWIDVLHGGICSADMRSIWPTVVILLSLVVIENSVCVVIRRSSSLPIIYGLYIGDVQGRLQAL